MPDVLRSRTQRESSLARTWIRWVHKHAVHALVSNSSTGFPVNEQGFGFPARRLYYCIINALQTKEAEERGGDRVFSFPPRDSEGLLNNVRTTLRVGVVSSLNTHAYAYYYYCNRSRTYFPLFEVLLIRWEEGMVDGIPFTTDRKHSKLHPTHAYSINTRTARSNPTL